MCSSRGQPGGEGIADPDRLHCLGNRAVCGPSFEAGDARATERRTSRGRLGIGLVSVRATIGQPGGVCIEAGSRRAGFGTRDDRATGRRADRGWLIGLVSVRVTIGQPNGMRIEVGSRVELRSGRCSGNRAAHESRLGSDRAELMRAALGQLSGARIGAVDRSSWVRAARGQPSDARIELDVHRAELLGWAALGKPGGERIEQSSDRALSRMRRWATRVAAQRRATVVAAQRRETGVAERETSSTGAREAATPHGQPGGGRDSRPRNGTRRSGNRTARGVRRRIARATERCAREAVSSVGQPDGGSV
jgi:hypothetical protein